LFVAIAFCLVNLHQLIHHVDCWFGLELICLSEEVVLMIIGGCWWSIICQAFETSSIAVIGYYELVDSKRIVLLWEIE
jgi:hypothetical protein